MLQAVCRSIFHTSHGHAQKQSRYAVIWNRKLKIIIRTLPGVLCFSNARNSMHSVGHTLTYFRGLGQSSCRQILCGLTRNGVIAGSGCAPSLQITSKSMKGERACAGRRTLPATHRSPTAWTPGRDLSTDLYTTCLNKMMSFFATMCGATIELKRACGYRARARSGWLK